MMEDKCEEYIYSKSDDKKRNVFMIMNQENVYLKPVQNYLQINVVYIYLAMKNIIVFINIKQNTENYKNVLIYNLINVMNLKYMMKKLDVNKLKMKVDVN